MRVHLVDGTFELYRAHFSPRPGHVGPGGRDLKASLGVVQSLLGLVADQDEKVTHLAVAFDNRYYGDRDRDGIPDRRDPRDDRKGRH